MGLYRRWRQGGRSINHLPGVVGIVEASALVLADGNTTVDQWIGRYGSAPLVGTTLSAPAATNRPAWDAVNSEVDFDGTDNVLRVAALTKGSTWGAFEVGVVERVNGTGSGVDQIVVYGTGATPRFSVRSAAAAGVAEAATTGGGSATSIYTTAEGSPFRHWSMDWTGALQNARVAGTVEDSDAANPAAYPDGEAFGIGAQSNGGGAVNASLKAWYIMTRQLTAAERSILRTFLTNATGVAC